MLGLIIASVIVVIVARYVLKKYPPQAVLFVGGIAMMFIAVALNMGSILPPKQSTGLIWLDTFEFIKRTFSSRAANLGLIIMLVGGFSKYMDAIGASTALVKIAVKPLQKIGFPYLVLALTSVLENFLAMFIGSASGFGLLLMVTMFPVLVNLGVSRLTAAAVIATASAPGWGPAASDNIFAAELAGMDIIPYFFDYQVPVGLCTVAAIAIGHYFVQQWFDKRENCEKQSAAVTVEPAKTPEEKHVPGFYALLPTIPLCLILFFGTVVKSVNMDISLATFIGVAVTMAIEFIRKRDGLKVFNDLKSFWDGMGLQMAAVVTLVVAGETFAKGLMSLGAIDTLINSAQSAGFNGIGMMLVVVAIIIASTLVMGSGNAPFFAFAPLAPEIATLSGIHPVLLLLPMNFVSNLARSLSPIAAVMMVISGAAGVSPVALAKRTCIPVALGIIVNIAVTLLFFYK